MKQVTISLIMFISAFLLLITVLYAWFSMSDTADLQPLSSDIVDNQVDLELEFGRNGGGTSSFAEPVDLNAFLDSTIPGDFVDVKIIVSNNNLLSSPAIILNIKLMNILASNTQSEYDLTDFFYLEQGLITLTWYASEDDLINSNPYLVQPITINQIDTSAIDYFGIELENYRLSNLFDHEWVGIELITENNISVLEDMQLSSSHRLVIEFSIGLDQFTPDSHEGFQLGELSIDGLYTTFTPI